MNSDINNSCIDMHINTSCSDGVFSPKKAVEYALNMKLAAISITDHNCVDGIDEALNCSLQSGIEIIPDIELSSEVESESGESEIHILGYYIDYKSEYLKKSLDIFKRARYDRAVKIFERLKKNGIELKNADFINNIGNKAIGRLHFAKALIEEKLVVTVQEAFQKYLSKDKPAYVPKYPISLKEAIKLVLDSGGIPVMTHPYKVKVPYSVLIRLKKAREFLYKD